MNNKELQFTIEAEKILQELHKKSKFEETSKDEVDGLQNDVDSEDPEPSGHDEEQDANEVDETAGRHKKKNPINDDEEVVKIAWHAYFRMYKFS